MTLAELRGVVAHASTVSATERADLAADLRGRRPEGAVLIETCHRVELHGVGDAAFAPLADRLPTGTTVLRGREVAEHVVALAVGLRSAVIAEDQILHQLRRSHAPVRSSAGPQGAGRTRDGATPGLDRLFELALRAGRRARSWLPARRPSLADIALDMTGLPLSGRKVLVVGTGEMGELAIRASVRRGAQVAVTGRTSERAAALAEMSRVVTAPFDPGGSVRDLTAVVVALRGPWTIAPETSAALLDGPAVVVDLSAPPALPPQLATALGSRLITIDDLARRPAATSGDRLVSRLNRLANDTVAEYVDWLEREPVRDTARAMSERAEGTRRDELDHLWQRLPDLGDAERAEIERMTRHLAARLLRDPLARLGDDEDGHRARAARELFGL